MTTRTRILEAAQRLVLERGFAAVTVDAVIDAAGVSKGAFFHHFPSKAALGRAVVERYAAADADALESAMAAAEARSADPAVQLVEFVRFFEEAAESILEVQPSCVFISFIYERELAGAGTDDVIAAAILTWRQRVSGKLEEAVVGRPGMADVDLSALADHVFATFEGAFLLVRGLGDQSAMRRQLAQLRHYLELLFGLARPDGSGGAAEALHDLGARPGG